ncbi:LPS export ABC transporter permease LptF [Francisella halioticida]|uniref:Lipopolysaccharide export system permease protein LptF n=1 Tax=Francisella halioticida TaxID=549298 RepID=A0ABN5AZU2_9GAMM|nr:LPS export ABC transporter permease LptF [Francisella halioticida]ASG67857.1 LPS export ABC transporter permease LptF [Francisella halioticida]BCD90664.1 LPS export ABC transporter permease LptF [Francisella halioticida]
MILEKYYNRDIVNTFTSITLFIISIVSANLLIRLFHEAYSRGLGIDSIIKFVILTLPENVSLIAPIAMFLAIIICFGKYFSNNEMFVTLAGGVTWMEIVKNTLKPAGALTILTLITTMYLNPLSKQTLDIYESSLSAQALLSSVTDDKIIKIPDGRVLYIKNKSGNNLHNVFLYQKTLKDNEYKVITAPNAQIYSNKKAAYVDFKNVNIYTRDPQSFESSYGKADKAIYTIYDNTIRDFNHKIVDRYYMHSLIENFDNKEIGTACRGEFFSRINNSIAVLVASLIALALCRLRPRQNKYAKLLPAVIVLAIYLCTNMFINTCMANGSVPVWIGAWLPHIVFVVLAIRAIRKQNGSSRKG